MNATTWKICNNKCGYITPAQGQAYNNGSVALRERVSKLMRIQANYSSPADFGGLLYADGLSNGTATSTSFWTISEGYLGSLSPHARCVLCSTGLPCLLCTYWMLIGACNPML